MSAFPFFSWRQAILKSNLQPTTRHILLTLSCHMNDAGESCYPSVELLMEETGLSKRGVILHLKIARDLGWITVEKHGFRGQKWNRNDYAISWPESVVETALNAEKAVHHVHLSDEKAVHHVHLSDEKAVHHVHLSDEKEVHHVHLKEVHHVHLYKKSTPEFSTPDVSTSVDTVRASKKSPTVTVNADGLFSVPAELLEQWQQAYPHVDLRAESKKARAWLSANPAKRKKNLTAFLVNWFSRTEADAVSRYPAAAKVVSERDPVCQSIHQVTGQRCGCHAVMYKAGRGLCKQHQMDEAFGWEEMDRLAREAA